MSVPSTVSASQLKFLVTPRTISVHWCESAASLFLIHVKSGVNPTPVTASPPDPIAVPSPVYKTMFALSCGFQLSGAGRLADDMSLNPVGLV